ncbi:MAG: alpha/beta fold hydrolase [Clostridia bacterium]|nr:alpha/beta fold hydrolase [Clostridia bacterium]MBQ7728591.1 alpha/beta fold hydrolase [Clostridia bacterium]
MIEEKIEVLSTDGKHMLKGFIYLPDGEIKGYFQIVHGMCEYTGRYKKFMKDLADAGYAAFGYDHLGHGETGNVEKDFGFIAEKEGWKLLCDDVSAVYRAVSEKYGQHPYYLFGHSMGSFIVRNAVTMGAKPDRLIVCGTGGPNPASTPGLCLCSIIRTFKGSHHASEFIRKTAFGTYNKRFEEENDKDSWLTKDKHIRDLYRQDPYCTFPFQIAAMSDLIRLQIRANKQGVKECPRDLPVLLISGEEDPVGDYGKGVKTVFENMKKENCDVRIKLYPNCRHEILNEDVYETVRGDILAFINGEEIGA